MSLSKLPLMADLMKSFSFLMVLCQLIHNLPNKWFKNWFKGSRKLLRIFWQGIQRQPKRKPIILCLLNPLILFGGGRFFFFPDGKIIPPRVIGELKDVVGRYVVVSGKPDNRLYGWLTLSDFPATYCARGKPKHFCKLFLCELLFLTQFF